MQLLSPVDTTGCSPIQKPIIIFYGQEDQLETLALKLATIFNFMAQILGFPINTNFTALTDSVCFLRKKYWTCPHALPHLRKREIPA